MKKSWMLWRPAWPLRPLSHEVLDSGIVNSKSLTLTPSAWSS